MCAIVNSGSSANLVAFSTLTSPKLQDRRIQKGDEVITVAAGFPTTVNPIIQFGAILFLLMLSWVHTAQVLKVLRRQLHLRRKPL